MCPIKLILVTFACIKLVACGQNCLNSRCVCSSDRTRVSCIGSDFESVQSVCDLSNRVDNCEKIRTLILRENDITTINLNDILLEMPHLRILDLRDQLSNDLCGPKEMAVIHGVKVFFSNLCGSGHYNWLDVQTTPKSIVTSTSPSYVNQSTTVTVNVLIWSSMSSYVVHEYDPPAVKVLKVYIPSHLDIIVKK